MAGLQAAQAILSRLEDAGYRAYLVGGCVRDLLLGRPVHDWDIATSALPEDVQTVFLRCIPTGLKHGTVTVLEGGEAYEVTTFRTDGAYLDGRRPAQVHFVSQLEADLKRRDFTMNAMAMDMTGTIEDPEGGCADLARERIACVGDPDVRFSEDALRMLRALRFSAQLDFAIAPETKAAIVRNAALCAKISAERVRDELEKTLCSARPALAGEMISLGLLDAVGLREAANLSPLSSLPAERTVRWAAFYRLLPQADLKRLRLDGATIRLCTAAAQDYLDAPTVLQWKQIASRSGWQTAALVAALNGKEEALATLRAENPCVSLGELAVNGGDFPLLVGKEIGQTLQALLSHVLEHSDDNTKQTLLRLAREKLK